MDPSPTSPRPVGTPADELLESIFQYMPHGVFVKRAADLRYVRVNRAHARLVALAPEAMIGRTDEELFPAQLAAAQAVRDRQVVSGGDVDETHEEIVATPGGALRILHTRRVPVPGPSGEVAYLLGLSEDVTISRAAREDARLAHLEAERASRAKSEFLSRMSHDLRTPLNAVLGFAQMLDMDSLSPDQSDSVQQILKGGAHLLELIDEVLDIARIESGHLQLAREPLALAGAIAEVVDLVRPLGAPRGVLVITEAVSKDLYVLGDRSRLKQVLLNLVGNAVKYNRKGGAVRVSCRAASGMVRVRVADTGPGIPAEKVARLFQPFDRLGAEHGPIEGTGLGLAVSKALMAAMGGEIGLDTEVEEGSMFWVALPESAPPPPAETAGPPASTPPSGQSGATGTVLYVEDNPSNVRLLERLVTRRPGIRLVTAPTAADAFAHVDREPPDLILLDLHLPDIPGEQVLHRLGADPRTRAIPVVVLSADAALAHQSRLLAAGAAAYLTKPLDLSALLRLLDARLPGGGEHATTSAT
jgi:PAS domain S-box-containing protein